MARRLRINTLRGKLQAITESPRATHRSQIEALRAESPHSIEVLTNEDSALAFNCVMYALGIEADANYVRLARECLDLDPRIYVDPKYEGIHADTAFVEFLASEGELSRFSASARPLADISVIRA